MTRTCKPTRDNTGEIGRLPCYGNILEYGILCKYSGNKTSIQWKSCSFSSVSVTVEELPLTLFKYHPNAQDSEGPLRLGCK